MSAGEAQPPTAGRSERALWIAVVEAAIQDAFRKHDDREPADCTTCEVQAFFDSEWFGAIADHLGLDVVAVKRRLAQLWTRHGEREDGRWQRARRMVRSSTGSFQLTIRLFGP